MPHLTKITSNENILILLATELQSLYLQQFLIIKHKRRILCGHRKPGLEVSYCNVTNRK